MKTRQYVGGELFGDCSWSFAFHSAHEWSSTREGSGKRSIDSEGGVDDRKDAEPFVLGEAHADRPLVHVRSFEWMHNNTVRSKNSSSTTPTQVSGSVPRGYRVPGVPAWSGRRNRVWVIA